MKIRFREGDRIFLMKMTEKIDSENYKVIDGSIVNIKDIIEIIKKY